MSEKDGLLTNDIWSRDSWRARAAETLTWLSCSIVVIPILVAAYEGVSNVLPFAALAFVGVFTVVFLKPHPKLLGLSLTGFWFLGSAVGLFTLGLGSPGMVTALAISAAFSSLFFGLRGLIAALLITAAVIIAAGVDEFVLGYVPLTATDKLLMDFTQPRVYVRQGITVYLVMAVLAFSVFYIARQQEKQSNRLQHEASERRKSELAFQSAQKSELVSKLTSSLTHNFGNALTVITTWTEMLQRYPDRADYVERAAKDMAEAARQATQVSKQIMTLSKNYMHSPEVCDLKDILEPQVSLLRTLLPANVSLQTAFGERLFVRVDVSEIQQALLNLVFNARDAMPDGGVVAVRSFRDGDDICLEVADNGQGIDPMIIDRVFEPFFSTKGADGTGLGLASVRHTAERSDGRVDVASQPGKGATFRLYFPEAEHAVAVGDDTGEHLTLSARPARILVADDEAIVLRALSTALEQDNHVILRASSVDEAIGTLRSTDVELLVTDAIMPGGSVSDLVAAFREKYPRRPVLVCSGYVEEEVLARSLEAGKFAFLQKPVSSSMLKSRVRELLQQADQADG